VVDPVVGGARVLPFDAAITCGLLLLVLVLYGQVLGHEFVRWDDFDYIVDNLFVRDGLSLPGLRWAFTTFHHSNWHPLSWVSHMVDCEVFGLWPGGHHLMGVLLHALNAVLLFAAWRRLTGAVWPSAAVAVLFAIHPLRVESVAWAAERKDLLSALFWMLALLAYAGHARRPRPGSYLLVLGFFSLALLSKPMAVTLPFVLVLLDVWPLGRWRGSRRRWLVLEKAPLLGLSAASSAMTLLAQHRGRSLQTLELVPLGARAANALASYAAYLGKTLWPVDLAFYYPHPALISDDPVGSVLGPAIGGAALVLTVSAIAVLALRRFPCLAVGWAWYLGTLVPVIGLVQVGGQPMADRYTYLPLIGIYVIAAWGLRDLAASRRWLRVGAAGIAGAAVVAWSALTFLQVRTWRDSVTLFEHALRATRDNYVAHNNLGYLFAERGELGRARSHFEAAVRIRPNVAEIHNNFAGVLLQEGDLAAAERHCRDALALDPDHAGAHYNLALALHRAGREAEAREHLRRAVQLDPELAARRAPSSGG
jgi:tetratricopeptide (TPR) repeat protein